MLLSRDIKTIIDLRSKNVVNAKPSAFSNESELIYYHFSVPEGAVPPGSLDEVPISYMEIAGAVCMGDIFKTIAKAQGGVLFYYTAGKDRTGVVSAVLLSLAGVSEEDIVYDYTIKREMNRT